jgi:lipopolysaccharide transport system permease protein
MEESMEMQYKTTVKPRSGWFDINLKELWKYRDLVVLFVNRTFVAQYKQTILGPAWAIIQPLLTTIVFTVVFSNLAGLSTDGVPPFLFYMCSNIAWGYFSGCLTTTSTTFVANANIFGKVYFPRLVMPIATVITQLISFSIQFIFFIIFLLFFLTKPGSTLVPNLYILLMPLMLLQMAMLSLGFGIIISALTTKYRDLAMLVNFGTQLWMYATPVAYTSSIVPRRWIGLYMMNPMTPLIEAFRYAFLGSGEFHINYYLISWAVTVIVLITGVILFSRVEKTFMDTI